jgi:endonuclease YncB( thermonuclease family)
MFKYFRCLIPSFNNSKSIIPSGLHLAKVVDIYDGDTITVNIYYCKNVFEYSIRLARIDTPELKYKGLNKETENSNDPKIQKLKELRQKGKDARGRLKELIAECPDNLVYVNCIKKEKYGRILGEVYPAVLSGCFCSLIQGAKSFNQILLDEKIAEPYSGGSRDLGTLSPGCALSNIYYNISYMYSRISIIIYYHKQKKYLFVYNPLFAHARRLCVIIYLFLI